MERHSFDISWNTLWRVFFFLVLAIILLISRNILLGLFMALVISSGLDAVVDFLERRRIPRTLGVVLIFIAAALVIAIMVYFVIPFLLSDVRTLLATNGASLERLFDRLGASDTGASFSAFLGKLGTDFLAGGAPLDFFSKLLGGVGLALAVLISSFYLSLNRDGVERFIRAMFPHELGAKALRVYARSRRKVGFWFQSQILLSVIMGFMVWIALLLLGVKHAFVLGILAAVFELVPFVGPILSGAVAVLMALTTSPTLALYTLLVFLVLQQVESHFLVPLLMQKTVDLHPVVVIMALLIGIEAAGFLGAVAAVPLAAVLQEVLAERE